MRLGEAGILVDKLNMAGKNKTYRIQFQNLISHFEITFGALLIMVLVIIFIYYNDGNYRQYIQLFKTLFAVVSIPVIVIHFEYWYYNFNAKLEVDDSLKQIEYSSGGKTQTIDKSNIIKVEYHKPMSMIFRNFILFPTDEYHYCKILLKSKKTIYVTSLMAPKFKIDWIDNYEVKQRFMAFMWSEGLPSPTISKSRMKITN